MRKKLKELIDTAPIKKVGYFSYLMIVPNGKYNGFWGVNGYQNIMLFGREKKDGVWYKISEYADKIDIWNLRDEHFELDIPSDYNVPVIWFRRPIYIDYSLEVSNINGNFNASPVIESEK